jgi:hypothetical protein
MNRTEQEMLITYGIPFGYIPAMDRVDGENKTTHLYKGTFGDIGNPMCKHGWNRDDGTSYSVLRNNISNKGICKTCLKRAKQGLNGVE